MTRYSDDDGTLRRASGSDYFSILPDEVELMFDLSNSLNNLKITGINSITIDVAIDYSEITDIGRWTGSATALSGLRAAGTAEDPLTDYESQTTRSDREGIR